MSQEKNRLTNLNFILAFHVWHFIPNLAVKERKFPILCLFLKVQVDLFQQQSKFMNHLFSFHFFHTLSYSYFFHFRIFFFIMGRCYTDAVGMRFCSTFMVRLLGLHNQLHNSGQSCLKTYYTTLFSKDMSISQLFLSEV